MFSHRPSSPVDSVAEQAAVLRRSGSAAARTLGDRLPLKQGDSWGMAENGISCLCWATMATENRRGNAMPSTRFWHSSSGPKPLSHFLAPL
eukprot:8026858-Pyramimonas_sp.AAC.1